MNAQVCDIPSQALEPGELDRIEAGVQAHMNGLLRDFRLTVLDDGLVLYGQTHTYYAKQLTQHAVMKATGVPIVANKIEVL